MIIGLHGLPGVGKDTFFNTLELAGKNVSRVAFAGPLKAGISAMLNIPMEDIENPEVKNLPDYKFGREVFVIWPRRSALNGAAPWWPTIFGRCLPMRTLKKPLQLVQT